MRAYLTGLVLLYAGAAWGQAPVITGAVTDTIYAVLAGRAPESVVSGRCGFLPISVTGPTLLYEAAAMEDGERATRPATIGELRQRLRSLGEPWTVPARFSDDDPLPDRPLSSDPQQ